MISQIFKLVPKSTRTLNANDPIVDQPQKKRRNIIISSKRFARGYRNIWKHN